MFTNRTKKIAFIVSAILFLAGLAYLIKMIKTEKIYNKDAINHKKIELNSNQKLDIFNIQSPEKGLLIYVYEKHQKPEEYAREYAKLSYYVAAIDSETLLKNSISSTCINLAESFSSISKKLQDLFSLDSENLPILVGSNEGATLVYSALAQSQKKIFHAGISINFDARMSNNNMHGLKFCTENEFSSITIDNSTIVSPIKHISTSWYIFQDKSLAQSTNIRSFTNEISNARLTMADGISQTTLSESKQILQWLDPRLSDQISSDNNDTNLPLIEVAATAEPDENSLPDTFAVLLTGDGGWAEIDKSLAKILASKGIPTIALDSLSYFWKNRTPVDTAKDVDDIINIYREKWHKHKIILIGYSFGADVLPFIANKLSPDTQKDISLVALLGMGKTASFKFRLSSWINADTNENRLPILPELKAMEWANSVCIYGIDDPESNCSTATSIGVKAIAMNGDHHFDKKYDLLVQHLIENTKNKQTK